MCQKCTVKCIFSKLYSLILSLHNYSLRPLTRAFVKSYKKRKLNPNILKYWCNDVLLSCLWCKDKLRGIREVILLGFDRTKYDNYSALVGCNDVGTTWNQPLSVFKSIQSIWLKHSGDLIVVFSMWRHHCTPDQWQITQLTPITNASVGQCLWFMYVFHVCVLCVCLIMTTLLYPQFQMMHLF